jgi:O-antigen/teichoic acid export membrane protein
MVDAKGRLEGTQRELNIRENTTVEYPLSTLVRKNSMYLLARDLFTSVLTFVISVYIVRKLSIQGYGIYGTLGTLVDYLVLFSALGLPSIYQRFIPEFFSRREAGKVKELVSRGTWLSVASLVMLVALIIVFYRPIGTLLKISGFLGYFLLWSPGVVFYLEASLLSTALYSLFLHKYAVISNSAYIVFRFAAIGIFLTMGLDLKGLILGEVVSYLLFFFAQAYFYQKRYVAAHAEIPRERLDARRMARYGGFSYFNEMGAKILDASTGLFVISAALGPAAAGVFAFANNTMALITKAMPDRVFMDIIKPAFFTRYTQNRDSRELEKMFNLLTKLVAFFVFPVIAAVFAMGDKLVFYIFDPKYLDSMPVLWIIAVFTALSSFQFPLGLVVQAVERVEINLMSKVFSVYNIVGDILVVKRYGVVGVAVVTGSAILFKNLFIYWRVRRHVAFSIDLRSLSKIALNSAVMAVAIYFMRGMITSVYYFFVAVMAGGLVYLGVSFINKSFLEHEREIINKVILKPFFVF